MDTKRKVEVSSAGCHVCEEAVEPVESYRPKSQIQTGGVGYGMEFL